MDFVGFDQFWQEACRFSPGVFILIGVLIIYRQGYFLRSVVKLKSFLVCSSSLVSYLTLELFSICHFGLGQGMRAYRSRSAEGSRDSILNFGSTSWVQAKLVTLTGLKVSGASQDFNELLLLFFSSSSSASGMSGRPRPTRAQEAVFSRSRNASATGPAWFSGGKTGPEQIGQRNPPGAVFDGYSENFWLSAGQSKTSRYYE